VTNKPKDSIVLVDEAYIHLTEAPSALDLVKAGKDVIVLRTFSKVYGMAGLRCGFVIARPDLIERVVARGGQNFMPVTAIVAATASLKDTALVAERRRINATIRQQTFQWLDRSTSIPSSRTASCWTQNAQREVRDAGGEC
jgi:histidinol-phosphate aminotransferase